LQSILNDLAKPWPHALMLALGPLNPFDAFQIFSDLFSQFLRQRCQNVFFYGFAPEDF
jgi:hypothetical protein